jgi:acid phosphatase (class A)
VLAQVAPERTDALVQRGYAFGQSRVVCGVHWQSDVDAGRLVGAAAVARLQSEAVFQAQLRAAASEVKDQQAAGRLPARDCAAEAAALQP